MTASLVGFVHLDLTKAPQTSFSPVWSTNVDLDFAGNVPSTMVRIGNGNGYVVYHVSAPYKLMVVQRNRSVY